MAICHTINHKSGMDHTTYAHTGAMVNVNVMDKETVLTAHENPEKYPELVVRVTGFTAYFSMLSPRFRQLVVDRIMEK